jgi:malonyl-CoA/methylmalonyl-CoA synthetase
VIFSSSKVLDVNKPGLVIFTSGSTGPPKGVATRRFNIYAIAQAQCWKNNIKEGFVVLQTLPTHHATGLMLNTVPTVIGGGCVEFTDPKFDAGALWDRIRLGGITSLSAVPTVFVRLLQHWDKVIQTLPLAEREAYRKALCDVEHYHCGSAALPVPAAHKWSQLCDGRHILERYGGTEFGNPYLNLKGMPFVPVRIYWRFRW